MIGLWIQILLLIPLLTAQNVTIQTPMGSVTGFRVDYGNNTSNLYYGKGVVFLGIPYAQPPIGNLRFQLPQSLNRYRTSPLDATQYPAACPQARTEGIPGALDAPCTKQSEDCLYLNVYTPDTTTPNKYPVMIWIHGGSLAAGCAKEYPYKGAIRNLVSRGVVVVVIQYRLAALGFFTTNTTDFPANRGLLDQIEAFKWVQNNIASFGGNPNLVTLFGQSAGGISISAHTYSPLSRGLFHQAIVESGTIFMSLYGSASNRNSSAITAQNLCQIPQNQFNRGNFGQLKTCMNNISVSAFVAADKADYGNWLIIRDNNFLPGTPQSLNAQRARIPVMYGSPKDEAALPLYFMMESGVRFEDFNQSFLQRTFMKENVFSPYQRNLNAAWNTISQSYLTNSQANSNNASYWWLKTSDIFSASNFTQWIWKDVQLQLANRNPMVYLYEQTYGSKIMQRKVGDEVTRKLNGYRPVPHSAENPFIWMFEPIWNAETQANRVVPFDHTLANAYGTWWTNFAKFGRPTVDNSWRPVYGQTMQHFRIDQPQQGGMTMVQGYRDQDGDVFQRQLVSIFGDGPNR
ncbi:unnamed protein product, partial [Mesorhabditis belari]|uniref:Carboxylic ester hydrolase n=1 Tax=Mesorhabditis belari TaxID=2138241 RepID=A0AAF3EMN2_9BILA